MEIQVPVSQMKYSNLMGSAVISTCPITAPPKEMSSCQTRCDLTLDLKSISKNRKDLKKITLSEHLQFRYLLNTYKDIIFHINSHVKYNKIKNIFVVVEHHKYGTLHSHAQILFENDLKISTILSKINSVLRKNYLNPKICCNEFIKNPMDSLRYLLKEDTKFKEKIYILTPP